MDDPNMICSVCGNQMQIKDDNKWEIFCMRDGKLCYLNNPAQVARGFIFNGKHRVIYSDYFTIESYFEDTREQFSFIRNLQFMSDKEIIDHIIYSNF
jgi:hypothetical protein